MIGEAFAAAYEPHVRAALRRLGVEPTPELDASIAAGQAWLEAALNELAETPAASQRHGPLELFQSAMRFPTEALTQLGTEPVDRDDVTANALPGDLYGLAPASSNELGEEAWHAHLAWGAAKAAALRPPPTAAVVSRNLMDKSKLDAALRSAGYELTSHTEQPSVVIADLEHPGAMDAIDAALAAGSRVIAFGPHVAKDQLEAAAEAGAEARPRSAVLRDADAFVASL